MNNLNEQEIKKLKIGEITGVIAVIGCAVVCACFIAVYAYASVKNLDELKLAFLIWCPVALVILAAVAAFFNLKYGKAMDKLIKNYVRDVFVENATLMHPEKNELTYTVEFDGTSVFVKANNYKERIVFDFSAFKKLSATQRANISVSLLERLEVTFCRLVERGSKYTSVSYVLNRNGQKGKPAYIIENGVPNKKAYKNYLKNR